MKNIISFLGSIVSIAFIIFYVSTIGLRVDMQTFAVLSISTIGLLTQVYNLYANYKDSLHKIELSQAQKNKIEKEVNAQVSNLKNMLDYTPEQLERIRYFMNTGKTIK